MVPSERTHIAVKLVDSSIRALCPTYPGAMVLHIGDIDFTTTLVGNSPELSLRLSVQALSVFLLDDLNSVLEGASERSSSMSRLTRIGGGVWKVRRTYP